ncbi:S46 family peptidase [Gemmatimonadota bacterium]
MQEATISRSPKTGMGILFPLILVVILPVSTYAQIGGVDLDTVQAGPLDNGKMWTFEYAPIEYFTETYGFDANEDWFERARMPALRIPGCSAAFVSPHGLVATNHHCVRGAVAQVSRPGEGLLDNGFYASTTADERPIPGYYADQLIAVEDISDEVLMALDAVVDTTALEQVRETTFSNIQSRLTAVNMAGTDSIWVQIVPLYNGGRYSAYVFRRFTDVRLVFAVELQLGFFGGDPDNFTYPRYALDFAFLRIYDENGSPYQTDHHFRWGFDGVETGDAVFIIGNPGPTNRQNTITQLEYQQYVSVPASVAFRSSRLNAMEGYKQAFPDEAEAFGIRNRMFGLSNSLKAYSGRLEALNDPVIMARRRAAERQLREEIENRPELAQRYGDIFDQMEDVQNRKEILAATTAAFNSFGSATNESATLRRAVAAYAYLNALPDSAAALREDLLGVRDLPSDLERRFLTERLFDFERYFGSEHRITVAALNGREPAAAAAALLASSSLASADRAASALANGGIDANDWALRLVDVVLPIYLEYVRVLNALNAQEQSLASELGRARFEVYGRSVPPDATFSPRITDGVVRGYEYNGTLAPPYTTFHGLYDRYYGHRGSVDWALPERWQTPPDGLDLRTPLNVISTADAYSGNSGSPAVTRELELVGFHFDRNIEGLSRDFIYLPDRGRNVMVDARAIHAALDHVYDADRIVQELRTGLLFQTEADADAVER